MISLFRKRIVRLPIVAVGAVAWLAISNHCALAAIEGAARMPMPSCHGAMPTGHAPDKHDQKSGVECCKVLRATLLTLSKNLAASNSLAVGAHLYVVGLVPIIDEPRLTHVLEWDTGPPGSIGFAELVLQRSILAHAPPVLA